MAMKHHIIGIVNILPSKSFVSLSFSKTSLKTLITALNILTGRLLFSDSLLALSVRNPPIILLFSNCPENQAAIEANRL